ncbi:MAG: DUF4091 domain-containing protein [Planctomycetes bacterium]|nr:DUF4091 domain-containing protein [Planctomycetota bacterium]
MTRCTCPGFGLAVLLVLALGTAGCTLLGRQPAGEAADVQVPQQTAPVVPVPVPVQVKTAPLPRKARAYDFGTAWAWPGFQPVPGADNVAISRGAAFGRDRDGRFPDPLVGDYVAADEMKVIVSGLPRGPCRGVLIAQNVVRGLVAGKDFKVRANGRVIVTEKLSPKRFFSEKGFFYGVQFDDLPGVDWWDRYVEPSALWRPFEFKSNGRLVLELENCRLYALVICPDADVSSNEFDTFITATQAARKAYFLFNEVKIKPQPSKGRTRATPQEKQRGYVVFSRGWGRDVTLNTVPDARDERKRIEVAGAQAERVPVTFSIRALKKLAEIDVSVSDLQSSSGATIGAGAVAVRSVRYMLRPKDGGYVILPETIQDQGKITLPARITKRWWLTLNVPPDAEADVYKGTISIKPENAPPAELELAVRVYPFKLAEPACSIGVWYSDPWLKGYCTGLLGGVTARGTSHVEYDVPKRPTSRDREIEAYRVAMLEADIKSLHEHGFNGITVPVPKVVSVSHQGDVRLDFSALEPYRELLKRYSVNTRFAGQTYLLTTARQIVAARTGTERIDEYCELHRKAYKSAVAQIRDWWDEAGVKLLAYAVDEPREKKINPWNRNMEGTLYYLGLIREVGGMRSTVTTMCDVQNGVSYRPILGAEDVVQPHPSPHNAGSVEYARESGKPLRFFNGGGFRRYDFGFYIWSQKPEGYWQWHFDFRDFSFNPFWDEAVGYVVYPSPDGPLPTLRYERAAQGILDYRYALTLENCIAQAKSSGKPKAVDTAHRAQKLLKEIKRRCKRWTLDSSWKPVRVQDEQLSKWRKAVAGGITAIKTDLEGSPAPKAAKK